MAIWELLKSGGFAMIPLVVCSLLTWAIVIERFWAFRKLKQSMQSFHLESLNALLRKDVSGLRALCDRHSDLPTAKLLRVAMERLSSNDERLRAHWMEALERNRLKVNQELKSLLWVLGTIASAAPFIGLFGTVVGILRSFQEMAKTGAGGFTVVAGGISEALIATATGIVVAVIAVLAFNAFQTRWQSVTLTVKLQMEELSEILESAFSGEKTLGA